VLTVNYSLPNLFFRLKTHLYKTALLGLGLVAAAESSQAQTADKKMGLSFYGSLLQYRGDLGSNFWDNNLRDFPYGGGVTLSRYVSKGFDLNLSANYSKLRFPLEQSAYTNTGALTGNRFDARIWSYGLGFKFKLPLEDKFFVHPYILLQPGFSWVRSDRTVAVVGQALSRSTVDYGSFDGQAALGLDFRLGEGAKIFVQAGQHYLHREDALLDGVASTVNNDNFLGDFFNKYDRYMQFSAGLTANFGKSKDTDGDGVPDRRDKCPDTPTGVKVNATGCPADTDGDGVADYQDKCPDVKGLVALQGCPDTDGDGVTDADDKCPNTPAGVKVDATGCPLDSDGDKVSDDKDKCPNTPAGVQVDATGCPLDRDGDGIPDYQDKCPDQAGTAANQGCPEIKAEDKKVLNEATKYINFAFNKATLLPSSFKRLDQIVRILGEYPNYSLSIAGHTDSKGNDKANLKLSYDRAASARTYLLSKGIPAERIEARGYGETKPIADNASAAGQAQNRRVDFDLYLTGSTNSAETKYGPAPTVADMLQQAKESPTKAVKKAPAKRKASGKRKAPARRR